MNRRQKHLKLPSANALGIRFIHWIWPVGLFALAAGCPLANAAEKPAAAQFRQDIQPLLNTYCSDCHADGMNKGGVAFDEFESDQALLKKRDLWFAVLN